MRSWNNNHWPKVWLVGSVAIVISTCTVPTLPAQVVQLPTIRFFNTRTVVSVPDGGSLYLGGINRGAYGVVGRGHPASGGIPYGGRLFRNRSVAGSSSATRPAVSAQIIRMRELEADLLSTAEHDRKMSASRNPNGSKDVQRRADFMTRHIRRARKR